MNRTQLVAFILVGFGILGGAPNFGVGMLLSLFAGLGLIVYCVLNLVDDVMSTVEMYMSDIFHFDYQCPQDVPLLLENEFLYVSPSWAIKPEEHGRHGICVHAGDTCGKPEEKTHTIKVTSVTMNKNGKGYVKYVLLNKGKSSAAVESREVTVIGTRISVGKKVSSVLGKWSPVFW